MIAIQRSGNDSNATTFAKAAVGAAVPLGILGAVGKQPLGALPVAIWGVGGGLAAAGVTNLLKQQGMSQRTAGIVGGFGTAAAITGVAALYGLTHGGIGLVPAVSYAVLPSLGAIAGGITAGLWH